MILQPYHFISNYNKEELNSLNKKINIIYRNYRDPVKVNTMIKIRNECKKSGRKIYLSNDIKMAEKLKLDGVYIPSFNKALNLHFKKNNKFQILGSAHNLSEIRIWLLYFTTNWYKWYRPS